MITLIGVILALSFTFVAWFSIKKEKAGPDRFQTGHKLIRVVAAALAALGIALVFGLLGPSETGGQLKWETFLDAISKARKAHKPVVIDAWATWCAACKELGEKTLAAPEVESRLKDYVRIKYDMTDFDPAQKALKDLGYDVQNLPTVMFIRPDGRQWGCRVHEYMNPDRFIAYIDAFEKGTKTCPDKNPLASAGFLWALLIAFVAGIGVSLTPCIWPVLPLVASTLAGLSYDDEGRITGNADLGARARRSLLFVGGMVVVYTTLGVISGKFGWGFGSLMSNPWMTGGMALVMAGMGLWYLWGFSQVSVSSTRHGSGQGDRWLGILLMGAGTGVFAAPCSGPVTVAILAYIAAEGNLISGGLLMLAFSLGLGMLFFVLGMAASVVRALMGAPGSDGPGYAGAIARLFKGLRRHNELNVMVEFVFAVALFVSAIYYMMLTLRG